MMMPTTTTDKLGSLPLPFNSIECRSVLLYYPTGKAFTLPLLYSPKNILESKTKNPQILDRQFEAVNKAPIGSICIVMKNDAKYEVSISFVSTSQAFIKMEKGWEKYDPRKYGKKN